jgi:hypothetical protein
MSLQFAREDYARIVGTGEFTVQCTFTSLGVTPQTAVISGLFTEHHNSINTDGLPVNSKNTRLTIVEASLTALGYVTRSAQNRVSLTSHRVVIKDINGVNRSYVVKETLPDNHIGGITLILGDFQ